MTRPECDAFLEDPESHAGHALTCESCGALRRDLDRIEAVLGNGRTDSMPAGGISVETLPLAPWEGANDRAWALVILSGAVLLFGAAAFFMLSGTTPLRGFAEAASRVFPQVDLVSVGTAWAKTLQRAPAGIHLILGLCFIAVNVLFVFLLRRQPKGIHVSSR